MERAGEWKWVVVSVGVGGEKMWGKNESGRTRVEGQHHEHGIEPHRSCRRWKGGGAIVEGLEGVVEDE